VALFRAAPAGIGRMGRPQIPGSVLTFTPNKDCYQIYVAWAYYRCLLSLTAFMKPNFLDGKSGLYYFFWVWSVIISGIILRLYHYLLNRSLYVDEAFLAVNFFDRGFTELLLPLDYNQRAPVGYLWGVKLFSLFGGNGELSLRFFSLLAGISSLFLFYHWLNSNFSRGVTLVGLFLLAIPEPLIYFSSEVKQYMLELMVTLIAFVACVPTEQNNQKKLILKAALGALLIWFSFPIVFVLVGIALVQLIYLPKSLFTHRLFIYLTWALSFLTNYLLFIKTGTNDAFLQSFWQAHFMPLSPGIFHWGVRLVYQTLNIPLGMQYSVLAVFALVAGLFQLWKKNRELSLMLILPVLLALVASALHKYPFHGRFLLFAVPAFITWIAVGTMYFYKYLSHFPRYGYVKLLVLAMLLAPPFTKAIYDVIHPKAFYRLTRQEIRPVVEQMMKQRKAGEGVFIHQLASAQFAYYDKLLGVTKLFAHQDAVASSSALQKVNQYLDAPHIFNAQNISHLVTTYRTNRTWFLFCRDKNNEEQKSLAYLSEHFRLVQKRKDVWASVYLYQRR
jgi:hypothetical protein